MRIFIICSVRKADMEEASRQEEYVRRLEDAGHIVHYPPRNTDQEARGIDICRQNVAAIIAADEIHVFYSPDSQGTHFDLGCAFTLGKKLVVVESISYGPGKGYPRMIDKWAACRSIDICE